MKPVIITVLINFCLLAQAPKPSVFPVGSGAGGGTGGGPQHYVLRVNCQGTLAAASASWPTAGAPSPTCDSAGGSIDGYLPLTQNSTTLWFGPVLLDSSFTDPITVNLQWNTTATTGTFIPPLAAQCISTGGLVSTGGFGATTSFASSTANGTASHVTFATALSFTTGCTVGQALYLQFFWPTSGGGNVASANLKVLDFAIK